MNKVIICGRLTREPEISNGTVKAARFNLALQRMKTGADFPGCVAFKRTAEIVEQYCHKGTKILLEGHIQTGSYERDGKKVFTTDVVADHIEFVGAKSEENLTKPEEGFESAEGEDELPFN